MRVVIQKIVYPGRRLALHEGKVIFTDDGLPGELVEVEPFREKKNFVEAKTVKIIRASARRVEPGCAHYRACSPYQPLSYEGQIEIKRRQLEEILGGLQGFDPGGLEFVPCPEIWRYRNKVRFHVVWEGQRAHLAYNEPGKQNEYVKAEDCRLVAEPISELLSALLNIINERPWRSLHEVEAKVSRAEHELLLNLYGEGPHKAKDMDAVLSGLISLFPLAGIVRLSKNRSGQKEILEWGRNFIEEKIGGAVFEVGARSFFQVNVRMLETVIGDIKSLMSFQGTERLGDLYCGLGTFGIVLAKQVKDVYGVESDPANIHFLKKNIVRNAASNFKIFEGPSEEWAPWILEKKMDAVIFDPPRRGLGAGIIHELLKNPAAGIIYLSCNPVTLARDIKELLLLYTIKTVRAYDFFPHTPHIETLAVLTKK